MNLKFYHLPALLFGVCLLGCGGEGGADRQRTHEVSGKVTLNGSPVAGATVTFSPVGDQPAAFGRTGTDGTYTLTTYDAGDGAVAGEYVVLVSKSAPSGQTGAPEGHDPNNPEAFQAPAMHQAQGGGGAGGGSLLPEKYASTATSPLSAEVTAEGENRFDLEL